MFHRTRGKRRSWIKCCVIRIPRNPANKPAKAARGHRRRTSRTTTPFLPQPPRFCLPCLFASSSGYLARDSSAPRNIPAGALFCVFVVRGQQRHRRVYGQPFAPVAIPTPHSLLRHRHPATSRCRLPLAPLAIASLLPPPRLPLCSCSCLLPLQSRFPPWAASYVALWPAVPVLRRWPPRRVPAPGRPS